MPRQIIIEMADDNKNIRIVKDDFASIFERSAVLSAVLQTPDMPVGEKNNPIPINNINKKKGGGKSDRNQKQ